MWSLPSKVTEGDVNKSPGFERLKTRCKQKKLRIVSKTGANDRTYHYQSCIDNGDGEMENAMT
jgi:hypothetical protein